MVFAFLAFPWVGGVGFLGRKYTELIGTRARKKEKLIDNWELKNDN